MTHKLQAVAVVAALFFAPVALADSKKECEAQCEDTSKICEDQMLKKLGKDNKAAVGQVKKLCADAAKQCKNECK